MVLLEVDVAATKRLPFFIPTLVLPSSSLVWELQMKQQKVEINPKAKSYCLFDGYAHLSSGLTYGLTGVSMGMAIGIVGDAGVSAYTITHFSNKNIEKELKAKMPSLDKKHAMEPEKVGHELLLYSRFSSSPVEIPENVLLEPSKKGRCWNELKK
ncbi:hypothetical protein Patl1_03835 [Pistacia atlantica]|uniref:Uncharacterized protein n=1 Tax=Pistacia atlantica TaxID=434234 RepID=A0ACC1BU75_9ROSI|nr:hypothetical protein Patl1_03835 [Pistacia atlantica]